MSYVFSPLLISDLLSAFGLYSFPPVTPSVYFPLLIMHNIRQISRFEFGFVNNHGEFRTMQMQLSGTLGFFLTFLFTFLLFRLDLLIIYHLFFLFFFLETGFLCVA